MEIYYINKFFQNFFTRCKHHLYYKVEVEDVFDWSMS